MNNQIKFTVAALILLLVGCVSSGPQTHYYSLFAANAESLPPVSARPSANLSFGVGPITLPEYMDNPAIVSLTASQQLRISGYHAWAGDLKGSIARVLSANLATAWQHNTVNAFPWDARTRPDYQIRIVFTKLSGVRGGQVRLSANWTVIDTQKGEGILAGREILLAESSGESVNEYVTTLNALINDFSAILANRVGGVSL